MPVPIHHQHLHHVRVAIDDLVANMPETPLERLQAALLVAEAEATVADDRERKERKRRRTSPPSGYAVFRRKARRLEDDPWVASHEAIGEIGVCSSREKACELAWEHHDDPEAFALNYPRDPAEESSALCYEFKGKDGVKFYVAATDMASACECAATDCAEDVDQYAVRLVSDGEAASIVVRDTGATTLLALLETARRGSAVPRELLSHSEHDG